ncbi:MAG TPA: DoxX family membrane protein, partial [Acidisoma sp.]|nr:DoxX family membrane protein [Acidisoma sp.]
MKIAVVIARVLLGLAFVFAGVMKFMPMKPGSIPPGDAGAMMGLMVAHKWMLLYGLVEAVSGLLLLAGRYVPLALTLLAGMLVNIMLFNATLFPAAV